MELEANTYRTRDLPLATSLIMKGHDLRDHEIIRGKCFWVFERSDDLLDLVDDFIEGRLEVDPTDFLQEVNRVKAAMYDALDASRRGVV